MSSAGLITKAISLFGAAAGSPVALGAGAVYGFRVTRRVSNPASWPVTVRATGPQNGDDCNIEVQDDSWYETAASKLALIPSQQNIADPGTFLFTLALAPHSKILPVANPLPIDFPAESGGAPIGLLSNIVGAQQNRLLNLDLDAANTPADFPTDGSATGDGIPINFASGFDVFVKTKTAGNVTGGGLDIWKFNSFAAAWAPVLSNVPLTLTPGGGFASIPAGQLGVRQRTDRLIALPNLVTVDNADTQVKVYLRGQ